MNREIKTEICVIGGGPSGASAARRLSLLGHDVCLIESEFISRNRRCESLPPGILPLLEFLDVRERIEEAGFYRTRGALVKWGDEETFERDFGSEAGFLVERKDFDAILLSAARNAGTKISQPARAFKPFLDDGGFWIIPVRFGNEILQIKAEFLIDASGRRSVSGKRDKHFQPATLAIYAYWENVKIKDWRSRIESGTNEWFWGAPMPENFFGATVFLDLHRLKKEGIETSKIPEFYTSLLRRSKLMSDCLRGRIVGEIKLCDASTYISDDDGANRSIKIGESGCAIDPLSSQGVQAAIRSGLQGAAVAHTMIVKPENSEVAAEFYRRQKNDLALFHRRQTGNFYAEGAAFHLTDFWKERQRKSKKKNDEKSEKFEFNFPSPLTRLKLSPAAKFELMPCLEGNLIVRRTALQHPALENPVTFIDGILIENLFKQPLAEKNAAELIKAKTRELGGERSLRIIRWLLEKKILISAEQ